MSKKRHGRTISCKSCGKKSINAGYELCLKCYNKKYAKEHPDVMDRKGKIAKERWKEKWRTDPLFREKVKESNKKWRSKPEAKKKLRFYMWKYAKTHPKINKKRTGYLCKCGAIDRSSNNRTERDRSPKHKCPQCGNCDSKRKVIFNKFTGEMIRYAD